MCGEDSQERVTTEITSNVQVIITHNPHKITPKTPTSILILKTIIPSSNITQNPKKQQSNLSLQWTSLKTRPPVKITLVNRSTIINKMFTIET